MCVLALIFAIVLIPETKGKTLEEISKQLNSRLVIYIYIYIHIIRTVDASNLVPFILIHFDFRDFRIVIGGHMEWKGMGCGNPDSDDPSQCRGQYSRIPSNTLQT